jgi:hypothetical protein
MKNAPRAARRLSNLLATAANLTVRCLVIELSSALHNGLIWL